MPDPLSCRHEDARRNHLRDGMALSTAARIAFFEQMVERAVRFDARHRLRLAHAGFDATGLRLRSRAGGAASEYDPPWGGLHRRRYREFLIR